MAETKLLCVQIPEEKKPAPKPSPVAITVTCTITIYLTFRFIIPINFCASEQEFDKKEHLCQVNECDEHPKQPSTKIKLDTGLECFTIKIGSFPTRMDAELRSADLRALRINNYIISKDGWWFVCVGKYSKEKRARETLKTLKQHGIYNAIVLSPHGF